MNEKTPTPTRLAITVAEMARTCSLSRTHFWSLVRRGIMPSPVYCLRTRRPLYTRELQQSALAVRQTGMGVDGRYVLFYGARKAKTTVPAPKPSKPTKPTERYGELIEGLRALGMATVTEAQVAQAVASLYPHGIQGEEEGSLIRALWMYLRRPDAVLPVAAS
ncbi:MAG: hypothetical protein K8R36_05855 [Planctomycetales bacterium]|nr:hypothetical protein [Planctomycetales bacterium]